MCLWLYVMYCIWCCEFRERNDSKWLFVCKYGVLEQTVREQKILNILNNSGKCRDISSNDSKDSGKAHVAEVVRGVCRCDVGLGSEACHMFVNLFL
jgi:hypothetical protein